MHSTGGVYIKQSVEKQLYRDLRELTNIFDDEDTSKCSRF